MMIWLDEFHAFDASLAFILSHIIETSIYILLTSVALFPS